MKLIAILLGLAVERFVGQITEFRRYQWLLWLEKQIASRLPLQYQNSYVLVILVLGIPFSLTLLVFYLVGGSGGYVGALLAILLFIYCIGPKSIETELKQLESAEAADNEAELEAIHHRMSRGKIYQTTGPGFREKIIDAMFVEANDRYFAVIFWFIVLGPYGVLLYRMSSFYSAHLVENRGREETVVQSAVSWLKMCDWIPAQLTALSFALTGSFIHALEQYQRSPKVLGAETVNAHVLIQSGREAVFFHREESRVSEQARMVLALIWRTLWVWVVGAAILTLSNWIH